MSHVRENDSTKQDRKSEGSRITRAQITQRSLVGRKLGLVVWIWRLEGLEGNK